MDSDLYSAHTPRDGRLPGRQVDIARSVLIIRFLGLTVDFNLLNAPEEVALGVEVGVFPLLFLLDVFVLVEFLFGGRAKRAAVLE